MADLRVEPLDRAIGIGNMPDLIELLVDAVASGASVGFLHPVTYNAGRDYWRNALLEVRDGGRAMAAAWDGLHIVGVVQVDLATPQNGRHRATVQKLLVLQTHRRRGLGRALLQAAELMARADGRRLLLLDVRAGDPAEELYRSEGWLAFGVVPDYALGPDGVPQTVSFWFKAL